MNENTNNEIKEVEEKEYPFNTLIELPEYKDRYNSILNEISLSKFITYDLGSKPEYSNLNYFAIDILKECFPNSLEFTEYAKTEAILNTEFDRLIELSENEIRESNKNDDIYKIFKEKFIEKYNELKLELELLDYESLRSNLIHKNLMPENSPDFALLSNKDQIEYYVKSCISMQNTINRLSNNISKNEISEIDNRLKEIKKAVDNLDGIIVS